MYLIYWFIYFFCSLYYSMLCKFYLFYIFQLAMKKDAVCIFMSATINSSGTLYSVTFVPGASQHLSYSRQ